METDTPLINYAYKAKVLNVHDGDTLTVQVDLGFDVTVTFNLRLKDVDAPELKTEAGKEARDYVIKWFDAVGYDVTIQTTKNYPRSFERYVGEVWLNNDVNLGSNLVATKHAERWTKVR